MNYNNNNNTNNINTDKDLLCYESWEKISKEVFSDKKTILKARREAISKANFVKGDDKRKTQVMRKLRDKKDKIKFLKPDPPNATSFVSIGGTKKMSEQMFSMPSFPAVKVDIAEDTKTYLDTFLKVFSEGINSLPTQIREKLDGVTINHSLGFKGFGLFDGLSEVFAGCAGLGKTLLEWLKTQEGMFWIVTFFFMIITKILEYSHFDNAEIKTVIDVLTFCVGFAIGLKIDLSTRIKELFSLIYNMVNPSMEEQGLTGNIKEQFIKPILVCLFTYGFSINSPQGGEAIDYVESFLNTSSFFAKYADKVSKTHDFLFECIITFVQGIGDMSNIDILKYFGSKYPEITKIAYTLQEITDDLNRGARRWDNILTNDLSNLEFRLRGIYASLGTGRETSSIRTQVLQLIKDVVTLNKNCVKFGGKCSGGRTEPTSMCLIGMPGTGKSILNELITHEIVPQTLTGGRLEQYKLNAGNEVFTSAQGSEYMEGYNGQKAHRIDDILQAVDEVGTPNPNVFHIINMVNTLPYVLNMAALELKGTINYSSELLFASDNHKKIGPSNVRSICSPAAFARRWDLVYFVVPKETYAQSVPDTIVEPCDRVFDSKYSIPDLISSKPLDELFDFIPWDWLRGTSSGGRTLNYSEVVEVFLNRYRLKADYGEKIVSLIDKHSKEAIKKRENDLKEQGFFDKEPFNPWKFLGLDFEPNIFPFDNYQIQDLRTKTLLAIDSCKGPNETFDNAKLTAVMVRYCMLIRKLYRETIFLFMQEDEGPDKERAINLLTYTIIYDLLLMGLMDENAKFKNITDVEDFVSGLNATTVILSEEYLQALSEKFDVEMEVINEANKTFMCTMQTTMEEWLNYIWKVQKSFLDKVINDVKEGINHVCNWLAEITMNRKLLLSLATGVLTALSAYGIYRSVTSKTEMDIQTGRMLKKPKVVSRIRPKNATTIVIKPEETLTPQSLNNTNLYMQVVDTIKPNIVSFRIDKDGPVNGFFLFFKERLAIGLNHYIVKLEDMGLESLYLEQCFPKSNVPRDLIKVKMSDIQTIVVDGDHNEDTCYFRFQSLPRNFKDITSHFIRDGEVKYDSHMDKKFSGCLMKPSGFSMNIVPATAIAVKGTYGLGEWKHNKSWLYNIPTVHGECGLPFLISDASAGLTKIIGIHAAGDGKKGLGLFIDRKCLDMVINLFKDKSNDEDLNTSEMQTQAIPPQWEIVKEVNPEKENSRSRLQRTVLYGKFCEPTHQPALLYTKEVLIDGEKKYINPYENARLKYGNNKCKPNQDLIDYLADCYAEEVLHMSMDDVPWLSGPRVLSFEESVEGIPGIISGLPRNTSAGYPWRDISTKKFDFFGREGSYDFNTPKGKYLKSEVEKQIEELKVGVTPDWKYFQFLKDELRPIEKSRSGNSRLVMCSPVDKSIITVMMFKDFIRHFQENRISNHIALGVNPYKEWFAIYEFLLGAGNNIIAGDYKAFDGNMPYEFDKGFLRVVERYYSHGEQYSNLDASVRELIVHDTNFSNHIISDEGKTYHAKISGITPSGDVLTSIKNSINNRLISLYAIASCYYDSLGEDIENFKIGDVIPRSILFGPRFMAFGDDNLLSIPEEMTNFLNQLKFAKSLGKIGFTYTDATKTAELMDGHTTIDKVDFLKRKFVKYENDPHVYAPLDLSVVLQMSYWIEKGAPSDVLKDTIEITLIELSAHGYDIFSQYACIIANECRKIDICCYLFPINDSDKEIKISWKRCLALFKGRTSYYE